MSRSGLVLVVLAATATGASAQGRPSSPALTCAQAAGLVASRGAVVLGTGGQTYDRYVSNRRFCQITEDIRPRYVPTRDNPSCFVGYTCFEPSTRGDFFDY